MIQIVDQYTAPKSTATPSEDGVAVSAFYAAVIDGATSASIGLRPDATLPTPGRMAMQTIGQCIAAFPPGLTLRMAADWMTEAVQALWELYDDGIRPTASVVIYAASRREVWQIGDCPYLLDGVEHRGAKAVDLLLASWRARATRRLQRQGVDAATLLADDPGRQAILPYLRGQIHLHNATNQASPAVRRRAFGVVDGTHIPDCYLHVERLDDGPHHLVLATDGYPQLYPDLSTTEAHLRQLLEADPLCVGPLLGTKGVKPGNASFDDRTYLSINVKSL